MSESRGTALAQRARRLECEKLGHVPFDPLPDDMHPPAGWEVCGRCYTTYRNTIEELDLAAALSSQEAPKA